MAHPVHLYLCSGHQTPQVTESIEGITVTVGKQFQAIGARSQTRSDFFFYEIELVVFYYSFKVNKFNRFHSLSLLYIIYFISTTVGGRVEPPTVRVPKMIQTKSHIFLHRGPLNGHKLNYKPHLKRWSFKVIYQKLIRSVTVLLAAGIAEKRIFAGEC